MTGRLTLIFLIGAVLVGLVSHLFRDNVDLYKDQDIPPIGYVYLATLETDPFLFRGVLMDETHPRWSQYRRALGKHPDVRSCLVKDEQNTERPNLIKLDWRRIRTGRRAEVCVFLIMRSIQDIETMGDWLRAHEFRVKDQKSHHRENYEVPYETYPITNIDSTWSIDQYRHRNPSLFVRLTGVEIMRYYSLMVQFSHANTVVGVRSGGATTLN